MLNKEHLCKYGSSILQTWHQKCTLQKNGVVAMELSWLQSLGQKNKIFSFSTLIETHMV